MGCLCLCCCPCRVVSLVFFWVVFFFFYKKSQLIFFLAILLALMICLCILSCPLQGAPQQAGSNVAYLIGRCQVSHFYLECATFGG